MENVPLIIVADEDSQQDSYGTGRDRLPPIGTDSFVNSSDDSVQNKARSKRKAEVPKEGDVLSFSLDARTEQALFSKRDHQTVKRSISLSTTKELRTISTFLNKLSHREKGSQLSQRLSLGNDGSQSNGLLGLHRPPALARRRLSCMKAGLDASSALWELISPSRQSSARPRSSREVRDCFLYSYITH